MIFANFANFETGAVAVLKKQAYDRSQAELMQARAGSPQEGGAARPCR